MNLISNETSFWCPRSPSHQPYRSGRRDELLVDRLECFLANCPGAVQGDERTNTAVCNKGGLSVCGRYARHRLLSLATLVARCFDVSRSFL